MTGIAGAANQVDTHSAPKCARVGCEIYETERRCLKVAQVIPGKGVQQWCSRKCWELDNG